MRFSSVVLPEPDGPMMPRNSPLRDFKIEVFEHVDLLFAAFEVFMNAANPQDGLIGHQLLREGD